jgi:hypothetical protein
MNAPQSIAHYNILSKLGDRGMGEVWLATDTKLNRDVAIKILRQSRRPGVALHSHRQPAKPAANYRPRRLLQPGFLARRPPHRLRNGHSGN